MGVYLNSGTARTLYKNETKKPYFIDKSLKLPTPIGVLNLEKSIL